jgi:hypothetical protein
MKIITDFSYPYLESMQQYLDIGAEARHFEQYRGIMFGVFDRKICGSFINIGIRRVSLDEPINMLWTDDPAYVRYLVSTFEILWQQSVPGAQRLQELLKQGPQQT